MNTFPTPAPERARYVPHQRHSEISPATDVAELHYLDALFKIRSGTNAAAWFVAPSAMHGVLAAPSAPR